MRKLLGTFAVIEINKFIYASLMLIGLFFSQINVANAQNSPIEIVASYGEALSSFCSMNDIKYREKIENFIDCKGYEEHASAFEHGVGERDKFR